MVSKSDQLLIVVSILEGERHLSKGLPSVLSRSPEPWPLMAGVLEAELLGMMVFGGHWL